MPLNLDSLFFEDYYGTSWAISSGEIRRITWSREDYEIHLPGGDKDTATVSLDNYIGNIRSAFEIWDKDIESINFVETSRGNLADVTVSITDLSGQGLGDPLAYWNYSRDSEQSITKAAIRFDESHLGDGYFMTIAMHEIGNILGLGDLRASSEYMSVQEDPISEKFYSDQLWDFDSQMINELYPNLRPVNENPSLTLRGTILKDDMRGGSGEDELISLGGRDYLAGYDGNDTLRGGDGRDTINGGEGDDYLVGGKGGDILFGDEGNDIVRAANGRDVITGGAGADDIYGGFGHNTFGDERDGSVDWLFFKSDQFAVNSLYGRSGMNPNGEKVDVIEGLDSSDRLFVRGVKTSMLSFAQVNNFIAPTGNFSGVGIFANGFLEGLYIGSDLTASQLQSMTEGMDA